MKLVATFILAMCCIAATAQEQVVTVASADNGAATFIGGPYLPPASLMSDSAVAISVPVSLHLPPIGMRYPSLHTLNPLLNNRYSYGAMPLWGGAYMVGSGSFSVYPAVGNVATANVGISQLLGDNLVVTVGVAGEKLHIGRELYNHYGFSGSVGYRINDHFSLNAFGSYYTNNSYIPAGGTVFAGTSTYGGSVEYSPTERFSVEAGVRRVYDPLDCRWKTVPILVPSVKIGDAKIGIDVGGLLYEAFRSDPAGGGAKYDPHTVRGPMTTNKTPVPTAKDWRKR